MYLLILCLFMSDCVSGNESIDSGITCIIYSKTFNFNVSRDTTYKSYKFESFSWINIQIQEEYFIQLCYQLH